MAINWCHPVGKYKREKKSIWSALGTPKRFEDVGAMTGWEKGFLPRQDLKDETSLSPSQNSTKTLGAVLIHGQWICGFCIKAGARNSAQVSSSALHVLEIGKIIHTHF